MSNVVIKVENLGKQYRLGDSGTGTFSQDLYRWFSKIRGKEDPYLKIGQINDRTQKSSKNDIIWALKDINFEVRKGEVIGIIGKNGAGKSTLLKILSRVTGPTVGHVKAKGRIASLLEVGTGFHPDLTGRENIFLNGAILGMTKNEIKSKLDEIIEFSGIERYIDTPVKRYSSGMYVRLAFGVSAHLESEILIVDEVLAVGDVEFQRKCLGKMKDVSTNEGRTVLFVSHNLSAVSSLCNRAIMLEKGLCNLSGDVNSIITKYLGDQNNNTFVSNASTNEIRVTDLFFKNKEGYQVNSLFTTQPLNIEMHCEAEKNFDNVSFAVCFDNVMEQRVTSLWSAFVRRNFSVRKGKFKIIFHVLNLRIAPGEYKIVTYIESHSKEIQRINNYTAINVAFPTGGEFNNLPQNSQGIYIENFEINIII